MRYADPPDLEAWATFYGVPVPPDAEQERLLDLATRDVQRHLGAAWDAALLPVVQADALRQACAVQALFRYAQGDDAALGLDDGIAAVGPLQLSRFAPPRFSPEAAEVLAGLGLFAKSGTVDATP